MLGYVVRDGCHAGGRFEQVRHLAGLLAQRRALGLVQPVGLGQGVELSVERSPVDAEFEQARLEADRERGVVAGWTVGTSSG